MSCTKPFMTTPLFRRGRRLPPPHGAYSCSPDWASPGFLAAALADWGIAGVPSSLARSRPPSCARRPAKTRADLHSPLFYQSPEHSRHLSVGSFYKVHALGMREHSGQTGRSRRRRTLIVLIEARNAVLHLKLRLARIECADGWPDRHPVCSTTTSPHARRLARHSQPGRTFFP
jgi:hypothetical protein